MRLRIYDGKLSNYLELTFEEREQLAKSLNITIDYKKSDDEIDAMVQKEFDRKFNYEDYNNARNFYKHNRGFIDIEDKEGNVVNEIDFIESDGGFRALELLESENNAKKIIRLALGEHSDWINIVEEMVINEKSSKDVAMEMSISQTNVLNKYNRALNKIKIFLENREKGAL